MDGEHIEMMIHGWASSELREKAIIELGHMREELYILRQLAKGEKPIQKRKPGWKTLSEVVGGLTKRVPDALRCSDCGGELDYHPVNVCNNCAETARR